MVVTDCLIPECYVDTNLVETISFPGCNHQKSCSMVAGTMQRKYADRFAVDIIDRDKREVPYLKEFEPVTDNGSIYLLRHHQRPHYILQISPAVEMFVLGAVAEKGLRLEDDGLPSDLEGLKRRTKTVNSKRDVAFRQLFKDLAETTRFTLLGNVLRYLVEQNYNVKVEDLKQLFQ